MKRILISTVFAFLLIISAASAASVIYNPLSGSKYNLGDSVIITGQITAEEDFPGAKIVFYGLNSEQTQMITTKYYSLLKDTPIAFSQINQNVLSWTIPSQINTSGNWMIKVEVYDKDNFLRQTVESGTFTISDQLNVFYGINKNSFNLGETLELSGTVLNARGEPIDGTADFELNERETGTVYTDFITITDGYLTYSYTFGPSDAKGDYSLELSIKDSSGNVGKEEQSGITVSGDLSMTCVVQSKFLAPGETTSVTGLVKNVHGQPLGGANVTALVTEPTHTTSLQYNVETDLNGNFGFDIVVPSRAVPGEYSVEVEATDSAGNLGECDEAFDVSSERQLQLTLAADKDWYYPEENMNLSMTLKNSGNIPLVGMLNVYVDDEAVLSQGFEVDVTETKVLADVWEVSDSIGDHTVRVIAEVGGEEIAETRPKEFSIVERPVPPKQFKLTLELAFIIILLVVIIALLYWKRKDVRELIWQREFRRAFSKK